MLAASGNGICSSNNNNSTDAGVRAFEGSDGSGSIAPWHAQGASGLVVLVSMGYGAELPWKCCLLVEQIMMHDGHSGDECTQRLSWLCQW